MSNDGLPSEEVFGLDRRVDAAGYGTMALVLRSLHPMSKPDRPPAGIPLGLCLVAGESTLACPINVPNFVMMVMAHGDPLTFLLSCFPRKQWPYLQREHRGFAS